MLRHRLTFRRQRLRYHWKRWRHRHWPTRLKRGYLCRPWCRYLRRQRTQFPQIVRLPEERRPLRQPHHQF
ncbi:TPA: hypothetical protein NOE00_003267, partial [Pseudomonas aeruginosa]|nr:hypothetical protein [Pseudomonas aeruginosa]